MDRKTTVRRITAMIAIMVLAVGAFALRLVQFQLVQGQELLEKADAVTNYQFRITAARGDIVDQYGRSLASNGSGYNLVLNKLMLTENLNDMIMELVEILEESGDSWNDTMPISDGQNGSYQFVNVEDATAKKRMEELKNYAGKQQYASAQQVMDALIERYELEEYAPLWQRRLAGVRYQMSMEGFSDVSNFILAKDVSPRTVAVVRERGLSSRGADITENSYRVYEDGTIAPHLLGSVGAIWAEDWKVTDENGNVSYPLKEKGYKMNDLIGRSGLEKACESVLRGQDGIKEVGRDKNGVIVSSSVIKQPQPGQTVVLTMNRDLQKTCNEATERLVKTLQETKPAGKGKEATAASVVVINVKTGGVLASSTYPSYDSNLYRKNYKQYAEDPGLPLLNRPLQGLYEPGSTFKPAVALAGLASGIVTPAEQPVRCGGAGASYNYYVTSDGPKCEGIGHVHGASLNMYDALGYSCNTYFYDLGRRLGVENFDKIAQSLGMAQPTGVELPESTGRLTHVDDKNFTNGLELMAAIGQGNTAVTPVQLATYAATLANKGVRYKTHFISGYRDSNTGELTASFDKEVAEVMDVPPEAFEAIEQGMIAAGKSYSALRGYPISLAVKTGSPQRGEYFDPKRGIHYVNSAIIAYGPVEDPQIAVGAVVEYGGGGANLNPLLKDIFNAYFIEKNIALRPEQEGVLLP